MGQLIIAPRWLAVMDAVAEDPPQYYPGYRSFAGRLAPGRAWDRGIVGFLLPRRARASWMYAILPENVPSVGQGACPGHWTPAILSAETPDAGINKYDLLRVISYPRLAGMVQPYRICSRTIYTWHGYRKAPSETRKS